MTHSTINDIASEANGLFSALASDVNVNLNLPELTLPTDFSLPGEAGDPAYAQINPLDIEQLTTKQVDGTGVFDALMTAMNAQMTAQFEKGRITGGDYAKVYLGAIQSAMQFGLQFLLSKDAQYLQNLQLQAQVQLAQAQKVRAEADIQLARAQIQQMAFQSIETRFKAYSARNEYAASKMSLVSAYNQITLSEAQETLVLEQIDTARAQTKDTLSDGHPVTGILGQEKALREAQQQTALENLDAARAQTKDTLLDGSPISGIVAVDKAYKEAQQVQMENQGKLVLEQMESARANTRDTLSTGEPIMGLTAIEKAIKQAQRTLLQEQVEGARAQTWETHTDGSSISGILAVEKQLKTAQLKYINEQYETQRGQTRSTLSTGEPITGALGAQIKLYNQQITSYQRDAESKFAKLVLDTWTARKTIDEGVAVPANIDTPAINTMIQTYRNNLSL